MEKLTRFGVSIKKELLEDFDKLIRNLNYPTRSKAIEDLISGEIVKKKWVGAGCVIGAVILLYDHHRRELVTKITDIQHDFQNIIISSQHVHLDRDNCLEIIVIKGGHKKAEQLLNDLKSIKGVKNAALHIATIRNSHKSSTMCFRQGRIRLRWKTLSAIR